MGAGADGGGPKVDVTQVAAREEFVMVNAMQVLRESKLKTSDVEEKKSCSAAEHIFRSSEQLPPVTHANLASFILENADGKFAANTAIVDGASGKHYSYAEVLPSWLLLGACFS